MIMQNMPRNGFETLILHPYSRHLSCSDTKKGDRPTEFPNKVTKKRFKNAYELLNLNTFKKLTSFETVPFNEWVIYFV